MVAPLTLAALLAVTPPAQARAGYEHNYPDVMWHTLETEHWVIHWPESKRPVDDPHYFTASFTAAQVAAIGEEVWPRVCGRIGYYLEEKTHVVIYDQDRGWEGNGFALAEWDWIGISADWASTYRPRGRMEFVTDVMAHEFGHIVSLKAWQPLSEGTTGVTIGGLAEDEEWLRRWGLEPRVHTNADIGASATFSTDGPIWWVEGTAELWSHLSGYNFWGNAREAFMRRQVQEDRLPTLDEWTTQADKWGFEPERNYQSGYAFGLYLYERFGEDIYAKLATASGQRWRVSWDSIVAEVTGFTTAELYTDWKAHWQERFDARAAEVEARGRVEGRELALVQPPWEKEHDEDWEKLSDKAKHEAMDGRSAYQELPSYSPDGRFMAWFDKGLNIREIRPEEWGAVGGTYVDEKDRKRLRHFEQRTATYTFFEFQRAAFSPDGQRLVATGPEDLAAPFLMQAGLTFNADGYNWAQLLVGTIRADEKRLKVDWEPIPGTLRAREAAWSPDGGTIVFSRYGNGTHNLWAVAPDGSDLTQLTAFDDGTQVQGISFLPSGEQVLVSLFRDYRQDLWLVDVPSGALTRLTDSPADETDPMMGPDGRAWFSSDQTGILNAYALDLATREVRQQTDTLGGIYGVFPAPGGHLFYTDVTGHGFRIKALPKEKLAERPVIYDGLFLLPETAPDSSALTSDWAPGKALDPVASSTQYRAFKSLFPLSGWPVLRSTDRNVEVGSGFFFGDYTEGHWLEGEATFGKDNFFYLSYWGDMLWPTIMAGYMRYTYKGTYGYGVDEDGVVETTDDVTVVDLKFEQASDDVWTYITYIPSNTLWMGIGADASRYSFRDTGDGQAFVPYTGHCGFGAFFEWNATGGWYWGDQWINPRGSRRLYVDYQYRMTKLLDPEVAGGVYDDGELLEKYGYHQLMASYTEFVPVGWFGLSEHHTLQLDFEVGWIDRNVMSWDEFMAGGRHPYHWGSGTIGNNIQFSGYEGWSLTGETMAMLNASYRFPLWRDINTKIGPIYTEAMYLQLFGTVGNLWSYRVDGPSHVEGWSVVADDPASIRREVPGVDYAYKNSPADHPNYWLTDAGLELRVRAYIFNDWDWDSFLRVAYGFQPTAGYGDVNADLVQNSLARDAASELSDEIEPPTLRVYLGIGTGW
ncbi:MAG: hypothetical protein ABIO70_14495 [Pseudomonadota bacterium]